MNTLPFSLKEQIRCVEREISYRKWVYPNRVLSGKMTEASKDKEIALMEAVLSTLRKAERTFFDKPWNQLQQKDLSNDKH